MKIFLYEEFQQVCIHLLILCLVCPIFVSAEDPPATYHIENSKIVVSVSMDRDGHLAGDSVYAKTDWSKQYDQRPFGMASDAGFKLNIAWWVWSSPGEHQIEENPLDFTQESFIYFRSRKKTLENGTKQLIINLKGVNNPFEIRLSYQLGKEQPYAKRKIEVRVSKENNYQLTSYSGIGKPYLRKMWPLFTNLQTRGRIVKKGGVGRPIALKHEPDTGTGIFWGMEYPMAQNNIIRQGRFLKLKIGDYYGRRIGMSWTSSNWVVVGLAPQSNIRRWFMRYVEDIRVQPVRPYLLYNSWYDLEAPQTGRMRRRKNKKKRILNERNTLRSIKRLQQELIQERGVPLDAFVLDNGWDKYRSDWKISKEKFPHGFKPLVQQLKQTNTDLGVWFGPVGGYEHRDWRVNWMKEHGYEVIGNDQLCVAGKNYHKLLKERITDFTQNRDIAYYKWDGIQFFCSNPVHGHPIGMYSQRAIMDSVISLTKASKIGNPDTYLNLTFGTWLSPWWVKYANSIWYQGGDYGYTNIPSISQRDRAITYRDLVLYDDFKKQDSWFPIANLMTHGIIKARLHKLSAKEPIDKFTNNALLYFARGVSMLELYVSPDLLTDAQWDVLAQSIKWAKDRFDIMEHTVMIGGDPGKGNSYGYAHFKGDRGVVIARNPTMDGQNMEVTLNESLGLSADADSLVIEQVYPQKWISPTLASSDANIDIDLKGYETAIYEVFPLKEAHRPLLVGATFETETTSNGYQIKVLNVNEADGGAHFLNPAFISSVQKNGQQVEARQLNLSSAQARPVISNITGTRPEDDRATLKLEVDVEPSVSKATLATLLQADTAVANRKNGNPNVAITVDGKPTRINIEEQLGSWGWYKIPLSSGSHTVSIQLEETEKLHNWSGLASLWLIAHQKVNPTKLTVKEPHFEEPVFPPVVNFEGTLKHQQKLGIFNLLLE